MEGHQTTTYQLGRISYDHFPFSFNAHIFLYWHKSSKINLSPRYRNGKESRSEKCQHKFVSKYLIKVNIF